MTSLSGTFQLSLARTCAKNVAVNIGCSKIRQGAIIAPAVQPGVTAVRPGAATATAVRPDAVTATAMRPFAVTTTAVGQGAVTATAVRPGAVTATAVRSGAVTATAVQPDAVLRPGAVGKIVHISCIYHVYIFC